MEDRGRGKWSEPGGRAKGQRVMVGGRGLRRGEGGGGLPPGGVDLRRRRRQSLRLSTTVAGRRVRARGDSRAVGDPSRLRWWRLRRARPGPAVASVAVTASAVQLQDEGRRKGSGGVSKPADCSTAARGVRAWLPSSAATVLIREKIAPR